MVEVANNPLHQKLQVNYPFFAKYALKIKTKTGSVEPFVFNTAQWHIHTQLEEQKRRTGRVRALILKGRQQGCSTYIGGRFYHKTTRRFGKSTFILSHEASTTDKLFQIVNRFQDKCPEPLRPKTDIANRRQLRFETIEGEYVLGTAGNEDVGRGGTVQYFHGSEVAFWKNTDGIVTGVMQSVPDIDETEVILESTANGMGNFFHQLFMKALNGMTDYIAVFTPWFWQVEYKKVVPEDFVITAEEVKLMQMYKLSVEQIAWRRAKVEELGSEWKFKQEYPCNAQEAFQTSGDSLVDPENVMRARKCTVEDRSAPKVLGVDPGRNKDRSSAVDRQGRHFRWYKTWSKEETGGKSSQWEMRLAGIIARLIDAEDYDKVNIDCTNGWGTHDRLHEMGYGSVVTGVHFGENAIEKDQYLNKRAEMWCEMGNWFEQDDVNCPDDDAFHADVTCVPAAKETSSGLKKLESKDKIKETYGKSPDIGDGAALTFAYPVKRRNLEHTKIVRKAPKRTSKSALKTINRVRRSTQQTTVATSLSLWEL